MVTRPREITLRLTPEDARALGLDRVIERGLEHLNRPDWLTVAEAAVALRVTEKTIRRRLERGELPFERVGRLIRIPASAVTP